MATARWPIAGAVGAAAACALLWGCPDANPVVVGVGGTSPTSSSSSSSSTGTSSGTGTTTTSSSTSTSGTGGSVGCSAANLFAPGVDYNAGLELSAIATGDMNGDGKPDLVVSAGGTPQNVVVLLNQGNGSFMAKSYTNVQEPGSLAVADLNGDGKSDVAVASSGTQVGVLIGGGDGTLGAPAYLSVVSGVTAVAAADLNADGKPDLAVADATGSQGGGVSVLFNMGGAAFADPASYPVPTGCFSVAVADLDGDGKPDVAIACGPVSPTDTGHVYVVLNLGGDMFATPVDYPTGLDPIAIVAVDLTGDGKPEIAVADGGNGDVYVLINQGTKFTDGVPYSSGGGAQSIAAADLNGDGHTDLAVTVLSAADGGGAATTVNVLFNQGDGTFGTPLVFPLAASASGIVATDLNGDGKPDVAVSRADGMVTVLLNTCP